MGLGLGWSNANSEMAAQLRSKIIDQITQQQALQNMQLQARGADRADRQQGLAEEQHRAALAETTRQHDLTAANQTEDNNRALNEQIPAGTFLEDAPPQQKIIGRLQSVGGATMEPNQQERPKVDVGPLLPGDTGGEKKRGYLKLASAKQQGTQDAADAKVEAARVAAENRTNDNEQKNLDRTAQIKAAAAARPVVDKLTKVEHKGPDGRTIIEYLPQSEVRGKTFDKGTGAAAENRLASAQAVTQTGDDIVAKLSDPKVAAMLGPALGRYAKMSDFIGNPPPEFSELAGQIESYALASMGVHGMRSAQGAAQIKAMLDAHHTPDSLAASIRGLSKFSQHYMQNEGRGASPAAGGAAKPTAEELIKKYGGD